MVNFKVGDEIRVIDTTNMVLIGDLKVGDIGTVFLVDNEGQVHFKRNEDQNRFLLYKSELFGIELVKSKLTKNQRLTSLEERVSTLEEIAKQLQENNITIDDVKKYFELPSTVENVLQKEFVEIIEFEGKPYRKVEREACEGDVVIFTRNDTNSRYSKINTPYLVVSADEETPFFKSDYAGGITFNVYAKSHNRTPETVKVYELIVEDKQPVQHQTVPCSAATKSNNELRAEIIKKAKDFVERSIGLRGEINLINKSCNVDFVVNVEKRTVVALIKGFRTGLVHHKGIAKCHPNDVFNADIGKAIALCRAIGLGCGEFENAVQPSFANGQIIEGATRDYPNQIKERTCYGVEGDNIYSTFDKLGWLHAPYTKIINDTHAIYGGVE